LQTFRALGRYIGLVLAVRDPLAILSVADRIERAQTLD
jgi:hypothetical protein